jgi:hypothetical protein
MKELEIKAMLADTDIPDDYKLGGRLDERFLAGVEYAERAMERNTVKEVWAAMDEDDKGHIYIIEEKPTLDEGVWGGKVLLTFNSKVLPSLTFENSPKKVRLILEDEE